MSIPLFWGGKFIISPLQQIKILYIYNQTWVFSQELNHVSGLMGTSPPQKKGGGGWSLDFNQKLSSMLYILQRNSLKRTPHSFSAHFSPKLSNISIKIAISLTLFSSEKQKPTHTHMYTVYQHMPNTETLSSDSYEKNVGFDKTGSLLDWSSRRRRDTKKLTV